MYQNILVPHTGTAAGDLALDHTIHISKSFKAEITLLPVIEDFLHVSVFTHHVSQYSKIKKYLTDETKEIELVMEKEISC